jgi:hypothetical protein
MPKLVEFVNGLSKLGLSVAAAALSATVLKEELIPSPIEWLGAAGTVAAACMIPVIFAEKRWFARVAVRRTFAVATFVTLVGMIYLRASCVVPVTEAGATRNYLIGRVLTDQGEKDKAACGGDIDVATLGAGAHPRMIPRLYGRSYMWMYYFYVSDYLGLLLFFVALVAPLELQADKTPDTGGVKETEETRRTPLSTRNIS